METKVIATIDVSKPAGRKLVRELESKRCVKLNYPLPDGIAGEKTYSVEESFGRLLDRLSDHYGIDMRKLSRHEL
jgi:hypothetical protein